MTEGAREFCWCITISFRKPTTGCFTTCGRYCRRWFPRSLWSKKFI